MRPDTMKRAGGVVLILAGLILGVWRRGEARPQRLDRAGFERVLRTVADGWNEGNARKAADCYAADALYEEPPQKQLYRGREALFRFFGGDQSPPPKMHMTWHHLAFNESEQLGTGEYTFEGGHRYHGIVIVRIADGKIAGWREYQQQSDLDWAAFTAANPF